MEGVKVVNRSEEEKVICPVCCGRGSMSEWPVDEDTFRTKPCATCKGKREVIKTTVVTHEAIPDGNH